MKKVFALLFVMLAGIAALGCSDDGVYTPVEHDDPAAEDCVNEPGVPDLGSDKPAIHCGDAGAEPDATIPDASK